MKRQASEPDQRVVLFCFFHHRVLNMEGLGKIRRGKIKGKAGLFPPSRAKDRKANYEMCVSLYKAEVLDWGGQRSRDSCPSSHCSLEGDNLSSLHSPIKITLMARHGWTKRGSEFRSPDSLRSYVVWKESRSSIVPYGEMWQVAEGADGGLI